MVESPVTNRPTLFDEPDPKREAEADARAEADVREGRLISHQAVRKWLSSWASGRRLPRPSC
jgi:predicted transcriptional regulator